MKMKNRQLGASGYVANEIIKSTKDRVFEKLTYNKIMDQYHSMEVDTPITGIMINPEDESDLINSIHETMNIPMGGSGSALVRLKKIGSFYVYKSEDIERGTVKFVI